MINSFCEMGEENAKFGRNKQNKIISQSLESKKELQFPNLFPRGTYSGKNNQRKDNIVTADTKDFCSV